jgi:hypothetical protein
VSYSGQNALLPLALRHLTRPSRNLLTFLGGKVCHILLKPDVINRINSGLNQLNPAHILTSCLFKIRFDIIFISVSQSPNWILKLMSSDWNPYYAFIISPIFSAPPILLSLLDFITPEMFLQEYKNYDVT